ncbi:YdcF family protein [Tanticharoenia sakaeratensis]|nr:YdcF family protein [Tanticharoenia sakaeratensis]
MARSSCSPDIYVVFGAAPDPTGGPSRAMRDRIKTTAAVLHAQPDAVALLSGGFAKGRRDGLPEALMMADLLRDAGIAPHRIWQEPMAADTLDSALFCSRILRARGYRGCVGVITSAFHMPRCVVLMRIMGWRALPVPPVGDTRAISRARRWYWRAREVPAIIWDGALASAHRVIARLMRR